MPTPQQMVQALTVTKDASWAIDKFKVPMKKDEFPEPFMTQFQVQQILLLLRDIYDEHIQSYENNEAWVEKRERHNQLIR